MIVYLGFKLESQTKIYIILIFVDKNGRSRSEEPRKRNINAQGNKIISIEA